ncbi:MAG TPA: hypothetical protein VF942_12430 [Acidimicrobiales bacterium]
MSQEREQLLPGSNFIKSKFDLHTGTSPRLPKEAEMLSPVETAEALRVRCGPFCAHRISERRRSLAELAGVVSRYNAGPIATEVASRQASSS